MFQLWWHHLHSCIVSEKTRDGKCPTDVWAERCHTHYLIHINSLVLNEGCLFCTSLLPVRVVGYACMYTFLHFSCILQNSKGGQQPQFIWAQFDLALETYILSHIFPLSICKISGLHIQPPTVEFLFKMAVFLCHVLICIFFNCCMVPTFPSASGCVLGCSLIKRFSKPVCNGQNYTGRQGLPWITYSVPQGLAFAFLCYYSITHGLNRMKCNEKTSEVFWHPFMFNFTGILWNLKCIFAPRPARTS